MKDAEYKKALDGCFDILKNAEGVNYILCVSKATDPDDVGSIGGHAWNISDIDSGESQPNFLSMVGGIIEAYLEENNYKYTDKLKFMNTLYNGLLERITDVNEN